MAGANGKYETHIINNLDRIYKMALNGCNNKEIYDAIGISHNAFYKYLKDPKCSELSETLKKAKEEAVSDVENALHKKAKGYDYEEETIEYKTIDGVQVEVSKKKFKKHMSPDTAAAIFILKNLMKDKYQNSTVGDIDFNVKIVDDLNGNS